MKPEVFVLRWVGPSGSEYFREDGTGPDSFVSSQKKATRFSSAAEAREAEAPFLYFGAGGPDDQTGWKVVRLIKKVQG